MQLLGRSAGAERRLGALLSSDEFRVESKAEGSRSSVMASASVGGCCGGLSGGEGLNVAWTELKALAASTWSSTGFSSGA